MANSSSNPDLKQLQQAIGYHFRDSELLLRSLTHPSYIQTHPDEGMHNQRLEFLGDAVFSIALADRLFHLLPDEREGTLSRCRSGLVRGEKLTELALRLGIDKHLRMSDGEIQNGGRQRPSVLEDALEALAGAIYLDSDCATAKEIILNWYGGIEPLLNDLQDNYNPKGRLQEVVQPVLGNNAIKYRVTEESGPGHKKYFKVVLLIEGRIRGKGEGASKKIAEEQAALTALQYWAKSPRK